MKVPLLHESKIRAPKGTLGILVVAPSDRCPATAHRLASTRVLHFEVSRCAQIPSQSAESSVLTLWLNQGTQRFCGEPPQIPWTGCSLHVNPTHDLAATSSRLDLGFEAQPRNCTQLRLGFLATMRPVLDPVRTLGPSS
jgi:hypothetical protein